MRLAEAICLAVAVALGGCSSCTRKSDLPADAAISGSPTIQAKLDEALRAKGPTYVARTRHKNADGSPKYTNRLVLETSPYLLQHAHNPVNWYAWGDEAFDAAKKLGRPVLLSVGYSTCHWCHVMEEESFEDEEIAGIINDSYVAIKVDREERPDVDAVYMKAVQSLTGGGGWPMTVWLTPERKPFYGGTYFPARDGDRGTRVGFSTLLRRLRTMYDREPDRVAQSSAQIVAAIQREVPPARGTSLPTTALLDQAASLYASRFDDAEGGLRGAPKFPSSLPIRFLLRQHRRTGSAATLRMATLTLEKMAHGGIYDHVAGGFHRYATDARWRVPHFEKMLYDNALLTVAYLEAYQATRRADFADVAREILRYVERDMTSPNGAFYSATDADSLDPDGHRAEGWFFTWTPGELDAALGADRARVVGEHYGVTTGGNFEGRSVLYVARPTTGAVHDIAEANEILYRWRAKRPAPGRDEKILTAWNGLMISAHAKAALALGDESYAQRGERAADFVLRALRKEGRLLRTYKDGQARHAATLDDYAFLIAGLLDLYEATGTVRWLEDAIALDVVLEKHHEDVAGGGFYTTGDDQEKLLAREKPSYDGAEPSGNSVHVLSLLRLYELTSKDGYRLRAERALGASGGVLASSPTSLSEMLLAVDFFVDVPKEIVIVTSGTRRDAEPLLAKLAETFLPNRILAVVAEGQQARLERVAPLAAAKIARAGKATAYVCERGACDLPTTDPEVFATQLRKKR